MHWIDLWNRTSRCRIYPSFVIYQIYFVAPRLAQKLLKLLQYWNDLHPLPTARMSDFHPDEVLQPTKPLTNEDFLAYWGVS